jgi:plastocyanin
LRRRLVHILPVALTAVAAGCDGDNRTRAPGAGHVDQADTLRTQGVEIADGRFVPDLVAVGPAQAVNFLNRDDVPHRIVMLSGPGQTFRSGALEPGETYRVSLVGRPGWRLRSGAVVYRREREDGPRGRIAVHGTVIPRRDEPERQASERQRPERPDWAAQNRARWLARYVSQCDVPTMRHPAGARGPRRQLAVRARGGARWNRRSPRTALRSRSATAPTRP